MCVCVYARACVCTHTIVVDKIANRGGGEGPQKFEAILGMQSQNAELKMHPRNFAHITARMRARRGGVVRGRHVRFLRSPSRSPSPPPK